MLRVVEPLPDRSRLVGGDSVGGDSVVSSGSHNLSYQNQYHRGVMNVSIIIIVVIDVIDVIGEVVRSRPPRGGVKIDADEITHTTRISVSPIDAGLKFVIWVRRGG